MAKSAIVTGASRGIGRAVAQELAKRGYRVLVCYRKNSDGAADVCHGIRAAGGVALPFQMDIADLSDCRRTVSKAMMEFGRIDVLVNNAGIALSRLFTETDEAVYDRVFDVNMKGMFFLTRAAAKEMVAAGGGSIVNLSSMWGISGASGEVAYSASKAAVIGFTKALAKELAPSHIRVNAVAPGVIDTDMNACYSEDTLRMLAEKTPLGRLGTPEEIASCVCFLAEDATFLTGQVLTADGGFLL
ncbi:MAG: 3-oxoacyl-ACP reductase [Clostridiales bacterium]|nr:MAG: 3-oxoacyl-ACP reductase [Clostridiales bacterium]